MQNFSHSGDLGDIIYSLPTIRACGGGNLTLFNFPGRTAHGMSPEKVARIKPLLECQDYIGTVRWSDGFIDHFLNGFRDHRSAGNLADMHLATHGLDWSHRAKKWLSVEPDHRYDVIVNRTPRYNNPGFDWLSPVAKYAGRIAYIGSPEDHGLFCHHFGEIPYVDADNLLKVAQIIAGCKLFIGNYSAPAAIAEGLKHPMVIEVCPDHNHQLAIFQRMGCVLGWDARVEWPDV